MTREIVPCVVCGSSDPRPLRVSLGYGGIRECGSCGSGLLEPRPSAPDLMALHGSDEYFNHPYFIARRELTPLLRATCEAKLSRVERQIGALDGKALVDVGCDLGILVAYAVESRHMTAIGIDIFPKVVELGRAAGRDLRVGTLETAALAASSADIICGFDLIEHVDNPDRFLREAFRVLKPGGTLALETPNYDGLVYRIGRGLAKLSGLLRPLQERLWPPFHVQYFTEASLAALLQKTGFEQVKIEGRELESSELAVAQPVLRVAVQSVFALARRVGSMTLLTAIARKPLNDIKA
ncbi:bifunctional 2-polyprenyl-6-hydroxyphenol methylase/3-demethylubiquinol 3-O-methyltransferase UbiG [Bradyrhizobium sp. AUGA SZCCT0431]|uniref:class I SAM-dependent methyltransferase n=1 Tax=Bradyrhizobium sp. AUGA SZCCT0431 TaxID=2807674 RepID=UPI001BA9814A|nr:class I SAM-dependent methyltransferase [Bradyrhizobium sp. AUGA SZCCT0431]MBR1142350.1 class I SAM-dependent methyltransferase [Bradyrhizobium sp. AUGA SZCCT0431]